MGHDSVVRQSYGSDYFAVQKSIKSTTIHHQLTQYCISIIIKQKEKSLNPCSLRLPCMVLLGSSGWKKKRFQIVLNGTERGTLVVLSLLQGKPMNSPEATAGNRILSPTRVGSHTGTPSLQLSTDTTVHSSVSLLLGSGPFGRPFRCCS